MAPLTPQPQEESMSTPEPRQSHGDPQEYHDGVEDIVHAMPIVLPVAGGVLMFLLAFIAIYMA
jgi:hypothetical protein